MPVDYTEIPQEIQDALKTIIDLFDKEEMAVRERQIRQWKKLEYMWAGFTQTWWDSTAHDWRVYDEVAQYNDDNYTGYYDKPINVFRAYLESIIAALSSTVPGVKCVPDDADDPDDISTAKGGNQISELVYKHVDAPLLWVRALFVYCLQGMVAAYNYTVEDEEYGTVEVADYEDSEETIATKVCSRCGTLLDDSTDLLNDLELSEFDPSDHDAQIQFALNHGKMFCPVCMMDMDPEIKHDKVIVPKFIGNITKPKARQCIEVMGGLFVKVPNYARTQKDTPYLAYCYETHFTNVLKKYEHLRNKFNEPTTFTSAGTDYYERWGRLNPQYYGEQPIHTPTVRNWWLRPSSFEVIGDEKVREKLYKLFPNGAKAVFVNEYFAEACNQNLDDHWTLTFNPLSEYIHFDPLGQLLVPVQEISQDLTSLTVQTIEHGIPQVFVDPSVVDFKAYKQTEASPGSLYPAKPKSGKSLSDAFYMVSTATLSGEVMPFSNYIQEQGQFVSGALPSLFGGAQPGSSRTAAQYSMSRNQALQRLQNTWKMINYWWKNVFAKVIPAYMKDMLDDEKYVKEEQGSYITVTIKKAELNGKIGSVECESSDQLPMTWGQVKDTIMELLQTGNPAIFEALTAPENIDTFSQITGLNKFKVPGQDDKEKQFEEIQILISQEPIKEPVMDPTGQPMIGPDLQPMMQDKASVPIDPDVDNHKVEADVCRSWLVGEAGRLAKVENPAGYQNVLLHMKEHIMFAQQIAMMNEPQPMPPGDKGSVPSPKLRPRVNNNVPQ